METEIGKIASSESERVNGNTEISVQKDEIENLLTFLKERKVNLSYKIIKRLMDLFGSLLVILLAWPIMIYIAIIIKKNSAGPAIFKQIRIKKNRRDISIPRYYLDPELKKFLKDRRKYRNIFRTQSEELRKTNPGKLYYFCPKDKKMKSDRRNIELSGEPFTFYKFRTMFVDAKERFQELYAYQYTKEEIKIIKFKIDNDPRVLESSKWLRKSSLDELPNFINVLFGDMSLVGPRPEIPEMMKYYTYGQRLKLEVKPGITGLAQIEGRGNLTFQETIKYDIEYVRNQSLWLDLKIIARTILETLKRNGAF